MFVVFTYASFAERIKINNLNRAVSLIFWLETFRFLNERRSSSDKNSECKVPARGMGVTHPVREERGVWCPTDSALAVGRFSTQQKQCVQLRLQFHWTSTLFILLGTRCVSLQRYDMHRREFMCERTPDSPSPFANRDGGKRKRDGRRSLFYARVTLSVLN